MAPRLWSILGTAFVMGLPIGASAGIIFNNFPGPGGITTTGAPQLGDQVVAAPNTPRLVTELDLGYTTGGVGSQTADLQAFLYANDGSGGSPGTLLWQSAVMLGVSIASINATIAFAVPSVLVPDTFTFTSAITNQSGNFGYAPAGSGTTGTFVTPWVGSPGAFASLPAVFGVEGRVIAESAVSVPEPATILLLVLGLAIVVVAEGRRQSGLC
jgi:PEP-CTERM motif